MVHCDNYAVFTSVFEDEIHGICFAANLLSGKQTANIRATINGKEYDFGQIEIPAMSVIPLNIDDFC